MLNASLQEPAMRGLSRRLLKGASEMGDRQAALSGEVSQRDFAIQAPPQNPLGAPYLPGCQTAADQARVDASRMNVRGDRMLGGNAEDLGDLLVDSTRPDSRGHVHGDAIVAAHGQGDREGDEFVHLHAEQAGYGASTPERLVTFHDIGADSANGRRGWGSAHGTLVPVGGPNHRLMEGPLPLSERRRWFTLRIKVPLAVGPGLKGDTHA